MLDVSPTFNFLLVCFLLSCFLYGLLALLYQLLKPLGIVVGVIVTLMGAVPMLAFIIGIEGWFETERSGDAVGVGFILIIISILLAGSLFFWLFIFISTWFNRRKKQHVF
jgi:ABC-type multidrug transport system fused ATPase/permease subunit